MELTKQERRMLKYFHKCTDVQKILILDAIEEMVISQSIPPMNTPQMEQPALKSNVLPFRRKNA